MTEVLTLVFEFDAAVMHELTAGDMAFAERRRWAWPLYCCPHCHNPVGLADTDKSVLDVHHYSSRGHWRECLASGAHVAVDFGNGPVAASPPPEESPEPPSKRRRRPRRRRRSR